MPDWPNYPQLPPFLHTWTRWGAMGEIGRFGGAALSGALTWPVANTAFYVPMYVPWPYPVKRVFWVNGTTITATNMDFGIYTLGGTRVYSTGPTAESGTSAPQYTATDFLLAAGQYYFALSCSTTTAAAGGQGTTGLTLTRAALVGVLQQASVGTLPDTATFAVLANSCVPICGVTRMASGF